MATGGRFLDDDSSSGDGAASSIASGALWGVTDEKTVGAGSENCDDADGAVLLPIRCCSTASSIDCSVGVFDVAEFKVDSLVL